MFVHVAPRSIAIGRSVCYVDPTAIPSVLMLLYNAATLNAASFQNRKTQPPHCALLPLNFTLLYSDLLVLYSFLYAIPVAKRPTSLGHKPNQGRPSEAMPGQ